MLDEQKIDAFLVEQRRKLGMTQADVAGKLNVSYQAVSKWENGALPNVELLVELAQLFHVTVDEILSGRKKGAEPLSYSRAGVDIAYTDAIKKELAAYLQAEDPRVLNGLGPFASLYDLSFPEIKDPVLVLKTEEPGSKQKLAMQYGYSESICHDMINHLVNDIAVMGARPLAVLDCIVCSSAENDFPSLCVPQRVSQCQRQSRASVGRRAAADPQDDPPAALIQSRADQLPCPIGGRGQGIPLLRLHEGQPRRGRRFDDRRAVRQPSPHRLHRPAQRPCNSVRLIYTL